MCISMFCTILTKTVIISLHNIYRLVFLMEVNYVLCEIWTESSSIMKNKFSLQRGNDALYNEWYRKDKQRSGKNWKISISSPQPPPPPIAERFQWLITPPAPMQPLFRTPRPVFLSRQSSMKWRLHGTYAVATWSPSLTCTTSPTRDA